MAYVVKRPGGRYELRESSNTPRGPRSRTLTTFRELTPEVIGQAQAKARVPFTDGEVRAAARRVGAPVPLAPAEAAAATLLSELDQGRRPPERLVRILGSALSEGEGSGEAPSDQARAAASWLAATPAQRGEALRDLLLLSDALPASRTADLAYPRIRTRAA